MRKKSLFSRASSLVGLGLCVGCGGAEVNYELVFPSVESFLLAANATVTVYGGADDPDRVCRNLSVEQSPGTDPIKTTGPRDVCEFYGGASVALSDIPTGRMVMYAEVQDPQGEPLMRGCRVFDAFVPSAGASLLGEEAAPLVSVTLASLPSYPESPTISCSSVDEKCVDKKTCALP